MKECWLIDVAVIFVFFPGSSPIPLPKEPLKIELKTEEQKAVTEEVTPATPKQIVQSIDKEVDQAEAIIVEKPTIQTTASETVEIAEEKIESDVKAEVEGNNGQSQDKAEFELEDLRSQEEKDTPEKMREVHKGTTPAELLAEKMKEQANPRSEGRQEDDEEEKDLEAREGVTQVKSSKHETHGKLQPNEAEISTKEKETPPAKYTEQIDISTSQKLAGKLHSNVLVEVEKMRAPEATGKSPSGNTAEDKVVIKELDGKASGGRQMEGQDDEENDLEVLGAKTASRHDEQIQVKVEKLLPKTTETQSVVSPPTRSATKISVEKITPQKTAEEKQPTVEIKVEEINPPKIIEGPNQQKLEPINRSLKAEKALPEKIKNSEISNEEEDLHTISADADTVLEGKQLLRMEKRSEVAGGTAQTTDKEKLEMELERDEETKAKKKASGSSELLAVSETTNQEEIDKNKLVRDFEDALRKERLANAATSAVQPHTSLAPSTTESNVATAERVQPERKAEGDPEELEEELEKQIEESKRGREEGERKLDALAKDTAEQDMEETQKAIVTQDDKVKDSNGVFITVEKVPEVYMETTRNKKLLSETGDEENTADQFENETKQV